MHINNIDPKTPCAVYAHVNLANGKKYIGVTTKEAVKDRWGNNGKGYSENKHFTNAIKKYGWDNLGHYVLYSAIPVEIALRIETTLIEENMTYDPHFGYNKTHGGELEIPSEETLKKMSAGVKKYYENNPDARETMSKALKEYYKNHPDAREAARKRATGENSPMRNPEVALKHKEAMNRPEVREAISKNNPMKRPEVAEKVSNALSKPVEAISPESGQRVFYFNSARDAERAGFNRSGISLCCNNKQKTHKGYIWRHVEGGDNDGSDN